MELKDVFNERLNTEIGQAFQIYENSAHGGDEWGASVYRQRLVGILVTIQAITGAHTKDVMKAMASLTDIDHFPPEWERLMREYHRGCTHG